MAFLYSLLKRLIMCTLEASLTYSIPTTKPQGTLETSAGLKLCLHVKEHLQEGVWGSTSNGEGLVWNSFIEEGAKL